jgi:hypothetical protein
MLSCNKDPDFNYPEGKVGQSKIIYFASVVTNGDKVIFLKEGDSYSDAGATVTLNNEPYDYTTDGAVNTSVPGVYDIIYSAVNAEGYSASDWRTVVVIGNDVAGNDFSGTYLRTDPPGFTSIWTKISDGIYEVDNPGGSDGYGGFTVIAVNYQGTKITIPHQISPDFGEVSSSDETYDASASPVTYSWVFYAGGFGTYLRTFTKQ